MKKPLNYEGMNFGKVRTSRHTSQVNAVEWVLGEQLHLKGTGGSLCQNMKGTKTGMVEFQANSPREGCHSQVISIIS